MIAAEGHSIITPGASRSSRFVQDAVSPTRSYHVIRILAHFSLVNTEHKA
jgi:hypothetical protein